MLYPFTDSSHISLLVRPQHVCSFMPQLRGQLNSAINPGPPSLLNGIQCPLGDKFPLPLRVGFKTSTSIIKDGGLEGISQLFRISQSTQIPQIPAQPVRKLLSYPLIFELANIQPRWYHSPGFELQLQSCYNKPVVGIEELSTPVDPAVLNHPAVTINEQMVNILCDTASIRIPRPAMRLWVLKP